MGSRSRGGYKLPPELRQESVGKTPHFDRPRKITISLPRPKRKRRTRRGRTRLEPQKPQCYDTPKRHDDT